VVTDRRVVGDAPFNRTAGGLWPSDHAAVIETFGNASRSIVAFGKGKRIRK
jgi:hypothetical protein